MQLGERLPFYAFSRRLPQWADRVRRPVDTLATAALMTHFPRRIDHAPAVLRQLRRPPKSQL